VQKLREGLSKIKKSASSATISIIDQLQRFTFTLCVLTFLLHADPSLMYSNPLYTSVKVISPAPAAGAGAAPVTPAPQQQKATSREEDLTTLHVNFLRDQTRALLSAVSGLVKGELT
jgi:hypothetical protein